MIVVDASTVVNALLSAGEARDRLAAEALVAPHLVDAQVASVLRRHAAAGTVSSTNAANALRVWMRMGVERVGTTHLLARVWELRENVSSYDATYVALAEALDYELVTADARLARATGPRCTITVLA